MVFIMLYLHPRTFYSYISLENSFVSFDDETYVGRGLVLDWCLNPVCYRPKYISKYPHCAMAKSAEHS